MGGSLLQVAFGSHFGFMHEITGFSLIFEGTGPNTNSSDWKVPSFKVLEPVWTGNTGSMHYAENNPDYTISEGEYVTFTIHPKVGTEISLTVESFQGPGAGDSCAWNEEYWHDTLRFTEIGWSQGSAILFQ
jgi:hypothetical protein